MATEDEGRELLRALNERAKELSCLYRVDALLARRDVDFETTLAEIARVLPSGWQFPDRCRARIVFQDQIATSQPFEPTEWLQRAPIVGYGKTMGAVEVYYVEPMPAADEGPFLKEERQLIDTVAARIAVVAASRDGQSAATAGEWRTVLEFVRGTDPSLLRRISRKMVNHLASDGVGEAQALLQRFAPSALDREPHPGDENRPLRRRTASRAIEIQAFQIAERSLSDAEILACLTKWIKEEKAGFLVRALERQETSLGDIAEAVDRFRHTGLEERDLSVAVQKGLRVSLCRRFFSEALDFINVAKEHVGVSDFYELIGRVILPPHCYGKLGGKGAGLFLARTIVEKAAEASRLGPIKVPRTWYLPSDGILEFIHHNNLEDVLNRKYADIDQIRRDYPHLVQLFKSSSFPPAMQKGLSAALDEFAGRPIIVRSSSLLEDWAGGAFSGKYKSLFLGNQGSKPDRLVALMDAIAEVYASVFGPDPTEYRTERGLLDVHEEMGILIQEVVGRRAGPYFLPAFSGVAFSHNEFRWSPRIRREDGLIRLVPGLGTRAVDRVADDYPVLFAPGQPNLRASVTPEEVVKYSPKNVDVINLETNGFETVEVSMLLRAAMHEYPQLSQLVSIVDGDRVRQPIGTRVGGDPDQLVFTFERLIRDTPFVARVRDLLQVLRTALGGPIDLEFASDGADFYLLQCRPQSSSSDVAPSPIPTDVPPGRILFTANRYVSNGRVPEITHVVYVDPDGYAALESTAAMREVGHAIGRLNSVLPRRHFILIGPGRWGSRGDIRLGVAVTYSDINNAAMLIEVARQRGNYLPDLSFGTHFFQDLVEASIRYLPLYPDDPSAQFNREFLERSHNALPELLPEFAHLASTIRVIDVPRQSGGLVLRVLMNADLDQAVAFLAV